MFIGLRTPHGICTGTAKSVWRYWEFMYVTGMDISCRDTLRWLVWDIFMPFCLAIGLDMIYFFWTRYFPKGSFCEAWTFVAVWIYASYESESAFHTLEGSNIHAMGFAGVRDLFAIMVLMIYEICVLKWRENFILWKFCVKLVCWILLFCKYLG